MNRREVLKGAGVTTAVVAFGGLQAACKPANLSFWVQSVVGALTEIANLIPGQGAFIKKIITVAQDFDAAYKAGKFSDALTLFTNLTSLIDQLVGDIGGQLSPQIKTALAIAGVAIRTIALLLKQQGEKVPSVSAISSPEIDNVRRLANERAIDAIYDAAKP